MAGPNPRDGGERANGGVRGKKQWSRTPPFKATINHTIHAISLSFFIIGHRFHRHKGITETVIWSTRLSLRVWPVATQAAFVGTIPSQINNHRTQKKCLRPWQPFCAFSPQVEVDILNKHRDAPSSLTRTVDLPGIRQLRRTANWVNKHRAVTPN